MYLIIFIRRTIYSAILLALRLKFWDFRNVRLIAGGEPIYSAGTASPFGFWLIRVALFKSYMFSIWNCVLSFLFYFSWFCRFLLMHCLWAYHVVVPSNFTYKGQGTVISLFRVTSLQNTPHVTVVYSAIKD